MGLKIKTRMLITQCKIVNTNRLNKMHDCAIHISSLYSAKFQNYNDKSREENLFFISFNDF